MGLLSEFKPDENAVEDSNDSAGSNYGPVPSGAYEVNIDLAYIDKSSGGATRMNLKLITEDNHEIRLPIYMSSGKAKGGKSTYVNKAGEVKHLPGFVTLRELSLLTTGKELHELDTSKKVIKTWNFEQKKEMPTTVDMVDELLNKKVIAAIQMKTVNKVKKVGNNYVPIAETRQENEIRKFFRAADKLSVQEILGKKDEPKTYDSWVAKNTGVSLDKTTKVSGSAAQLDDPDIPIPAQKSLFSKDE